MKQHSFEKQHQGTWQDFSSIVDELEKVDKKGKKNIIQCSSFPFLYREICNHYSLSLKRCYTPAVTKKLHHLVLRGYRQLHKPKKAAFTAVFYFLWHTFPSQLRSSLYYFFFSLFAFLVPAFVSGYFCYTNPFALQHIISPEKVIKIEKMYNPTDKQGSRSIVRSNEKDLFMFGYYIKNNTSIGLNTFAGGLLFGVGALITLIYNGIVLGGISGHLSYAPFAETFWPFVAGHSSWELTAVVISGAAGLMLGKSLLFPGRYTRKDSLKIIAPKALQLAMGAAGMFFIAAFIEAFWSASLFSPFVKYSFSFVNWSVVICYLAFSGRANGIK